MTSENKNDKSLIDYYEKIQAFAQNEIIRSSANYKILLGLLSIAFIFLVGSVYYFFGSTKSDLDKKYEANYIRYENDYKVVIGNAQLKLERSIDSIFFVEKNSISKQIAGEFSEDKIKMLVEKEAQKRIDNIADSIIKTKIESYFNDNFAEELKIYFDLSFYYTQVHNQSDIASFIKLVDCYNTAKEQRVKDRALMYINSLLEIWEFNAKLDVERAKRELHLPNLLDLKDKSVDLKLKGFIEKPDILDFDIFLLCVKAYNYRHKTNYMPYEYKKILKIEDWP